MKSKVGSTWSFEREKSEGLKIQMSGTLIEVRVIFLLANRKQSCLCGMNKIKLKLKMKKVIAAHGYVNVSNKRRSGKQEYG